MKFPVLAIAAAALLPVLAASANPGKTAGGLVVYTPHPGDFVDAIVKEFEVESGIRVEVVQAGTGELLKMVRAGSAEPRGDVVWGGSRASLEGYKDCFEPYRSANAAAFDPRWRVEGDAYTPFTAVPTVIMYNRNLVPGDRAPTSWKDLLSPAWKGRIAFADPALSSSSFEALVNMVLAMGGKGEAGWAYVKAFVDNLDGRLLSGSSAVYRGVAEGEFPVGVTFEEAAATYARQGAPVGIVYPSEGAVVEPDGVAVVKGAAHREAARRFIDFVTSRKVQERIARELNRRSCRLDVAAASGLPALSSIHTLPGDYLWAVAAKDSILARFAALSPGRTAGPGPGR